MPLLKVTPFVAKPGGSSTGFSVSQGETSSGVFFRFSIKSDAQEKHFGRVLDPEKDAIALRVTNDRQYSHLIGMKVVSVDDAEAIPLARSPNNGVQFRVVSWRPGKGKMPAAMMQIVNEHVDGGGISLKLPEWARPPADPKS